MSNLIDRFVKTLLLATLLATGSYGMDMDRVQTVGGTVRISRDINTFEGRVLLNGRVIYRYEGASISIAKRVSLPRSTIVLLEEQAGMGTTPAYRVLEVYGDGSFRLSREVFSDDFDFEPRVKRVGRDEIRIDLGYSKGRKKIARYRNAKLTVTYERSQRQALSKSDCHWLYDTVYRGYLEVGKCGLSIGYAIGNGLYHGYYALLQQGVFDDDSFTRFTQRSCRKRRAISYRDFSRTVCRGDMNGAERRLGR